MNDACSELAPPAAQHAADGGDLSVAFESMSETEAIETAARYFGVTATAQRFATEKDDTFRLDADDGQRYVLKIANPSEDPLELDFQVELLRHIELRDPSLPVPRVWFGANGMRLFKVPTLAGVDRYVRLMSFMPGTPLDRTSASAPQRELIGEMLARLRLATAGFDHPGDTRYMPWDVTNLPSLAHLLPHIAVPSHRDLVERTLQRFAEIEPILARSRRQVLHNDFNTSNIVVDHARPDYVTGIIDFGDAVRTAIACDVATAVQNQLPRHTPADLSEDIFEPARDVVRGYLRHAELTNEELALIPHLAISRSATRALLTSWRAGLFPENSPYILRHTRPGWRHLEWFLHRSADEVSHLLGSFFR